MQTKEIQTNEDILQTLAVLQQIYDNLAQNNYMERVLTMMESGYKMAAVFEDQMVENGRCIGVVGIRVVEKIQHGRVVEIEDFMIDRQKRGIGVGKMLLRWVDWQAAMFKCSNIIGSLETKRQESQKIFSREKFILDGFFFRKPC
jgi:GNAT superfamily N-acetyltransferase